MCRQLYKPLTRLRVVLFFFFFLRIPFYFVGEKERERAKIIKEQLFAGVSLAHSNFLNG